MIGRRDFIGTFAAAAGLAWVAPALAAGYPDRPIKLVVPFPPGGPNDVIARFVANRISAGLGVSVIVENRSGAGATLGTKMVGAAEADGYTLLFGSTGSLAVTPALYGNSGYDPVRSFVPIAAVSSGPLLLAVSPALPVKTVDELVAYAKSNPGRLNYGSSIGTPPHVAWGMFKVQTGTDVVYVPYKGAAQAITDLLAGRMHMIIDTAGILLPHIRAGTLRALAVTSAARSATFPGIPTMMESGYRDFAITVWTGLVAPAGTPSSVIDRLNNVINSGLQTPEMQANLAGFQVQPIPGSPQEFASLIAAEAQKWSAVIKAAGIQIE
jgi:tripartite-type tricarboxylate transporter receptor subunit TctC